MRHSYQATLGACFAGYIVQSVINLFAPLLFLTFQREFSLSLDQIALLITVNFLVQLCVDGLSARFVDKIGWRVCMVAAHLFAALGLVLLAVLPGRIPPLAGLTVAVVIYALGGGLLEVLVSPIAEACPTRRKSAVMGLLHSFYCWGSVATIALSTLFFVCFGTQNWRILAMLWALLPLVNALVFTQVPLATLTPEGESGLSLGQLFRTPRFWLFLLLMACAGASELSISQWASAFAVCAGRVQDGGRSGRTAVLCPADGPVSAGIRRIQPQPPLPHRLYDGQYHPVYCRIPAGLPLPLARSGAGGVRPVRHGGGLHVAGHL